MAKGINFKFPMKHSPRGAFQINESTIEAVTDNIRMLLLTNHGERPIHYDFGANLRGIVFDQAPDASQRVVDSVSVAMEKWMPFVKIDSIIVEDYNSNKGLNANEINVKLKFSIGQLEGSLEQRIR